MRISHTFCTCIFSKIYSFGGFSATYSTLQEAMVVLLDVQITANDIYEYGMDDPVAGKEASFSLQIRESQVVSNPSMVPAGKMAVPIFPLVPCLKLHRDCIRFHPCPSVALIFDVFMYSIRFVLQTLRRPVQVYF
jgi:hypothetical protein